MSRPWNVRNFVANHPTGIRDLSRGFQTIAFNDSRINPLSGSTKYWPFLVFTMTALREVPTPGSTTATNTVPAG